MKIYGDKQSGNCYKVQLVCQLLNLSYDWLDIDILAGDTKTAAFLAKTRAGQPTSLCQTQPTMQSSLSCCSAFGRFKSSLKRTLVCANIGLFWLYVAYW